MRKAGEEMSDFPRIKELGLEVKDGYLSFAHAEESICREQGAYVRAADLEKILSEGVRVERCEYGTEAWWRDPKEVVKDSPDIRQTHTALLLNPKPHRAGHL